MTTKFRTILIELTGPFCGCELAKESPSNAFSIFLPDGSFPLRIQCKQCGKEFKERHSKLNGRVIYTKPKEPKQPEKRTKVIERAVQSREAAKKAKPTSYLSIVKQLKGLGYSSQEILDEIRMRMEQHDTHMEEMDRHLADAAEVLRTQKTKPAPVLAPIWAPPQWSSKTVTTTPAPEPPEPETSQPDPVAPKPEPPPKPDTRPAYMRALDLESQE